eukprot:462878_1
MNDNDGDLWNDDYKEPEPIKSQKPRPATKKCVNSDVNGNYIRPTASIKSQINKPRIQPKMNDNDGDLWNDDYKEPEPIKSQKPRPATKKCVNSDVNGNYIRPTSSIKSQTDKPRIPSNEPVINDNDYKEPGSAITKPSLSSTFNGFKAGRRSKKYINADKVQSNQSMMNHRKPGSLSSTSRGFKPSRRAEKDDSDENRNCIRPSFAMRRNNTTPRSLSGKSKGFRRSQRAIKCPQNNGDSAKNKRYQPPRDEHKYPY